MNSVKRLVALCTLLLFSLQVLAVPVDGGCTHRTNSMEQGMIPTDENAHGHHAMADLMNAESKSESGCDCEEICATSCSWAGQQTSVRTLWGYSFSKMNVVPLSMTDLSLTNPHLSRKFRPPISLVF